MRTSASIVILSTLTFMGTPAIAVSFDPQTGMIQQTQAEIDASQDKANIESWSLANQANGTATSAKYFADKNHADLKAVKASIAETNSQNNAAFQNQQQHLEVHDKAITVLATGLDSTNAAVKENTRRLDTDDRQLDHLQQVANSQGADIRTNAANIKTVSANSDQAKVWATAANRNSNAASVEAGTARQIAEENKAVVEANSAAISIVKGDTAAAKATADRAKAVNESQDKQIRTETAERIKGYTDTNKRVDESFTVLGNHEDRIVTLEGKEQATSDRVDIVRNEQARQANKQIETDRKVSQVDDTAKRGVTIATDAKKTAVEQKQYNEQQNAWITDVQTKSDIAVSKVPVFEKGISEAHERIDGLDRKTDQTASDASYAKGKADFNDGRINELNAKTDTTNATVAGHTATLQQYEENINTLNQTANDHDARITSNTNRISNVEGGLAQTNQNVSTVYHNTQVNAQNIDTLNKDIQTVDRASIERSKAAVFESNAYTDARTQALETKMDQQYNKVRREAFAGVASVAAMANMPFVAGEGWSLSASTGFYKGASAAAMGVQYQPSTNDAFRISGSISNGGDGAFGAGFSHHF